MVRGASTGSQREVNPSPIVGSPRQLACPGDGQDNPLQVTAKDEQRGYPGPRLRQPEGGGIKKRSAPSHDKASVLAFRRPVSPPGARKTSHSKRKKDTIHPHCSNQTKATISQLLAEPDKELSSNKRFS